MILWAGWAFLGLFLVLDEEAEENPQNRFEVASDEIRRPIPARKSSEVGEKLEDEFHVEEALLVSCRFWMVLIERDKKSLNENFPTFFTTFKSLKSYSWNGLIGIEKLLLKDCWMLKPTFWESSIGDKVFNLILFKEWISFRFTFQLSNE